MSIRYARALLTLMTGLSTLGFAVSPPAQAADPSQIRVPMQFHFATHDDWCNPQAIAKLEEAMKRGRVAYELHRYEAQHAFMNEARPEVHNPETAKLAWERTLKFLATNLSA